MLRKQQLTSTVTKDTSDGSAPPSPASTGAMDTLLAKLRAAAPEARDQRDRRRRARLKDRHQVRVASGQKIPEMDSLVSKSDDGESVNGLLSPISDIQLSETTASTPTSVDTPNLDLASPTEDVADRAASLLQSLGSDDNARSSRLRESADAERMRRRRRRAGGNSESGSAQRTDSMQTLLTSTITEESGEGVDTPTDGGELNTPTNGEAEPVGSVVVSPPSPVLAAGEQGKPAEE